MSNSNNYGYWLIRNIDNNNSTDEEYNYIIVYNICLIIIKEYDCADDRIKFVFEVVDVCVS